MKYISVFLFVLILSNLFGQEEEIPAMGNVFWEISKENNKKVSYLFGTIHLIDKDKYVFPKIVGKRLEIADLLYMEIADMENPSNMVEMITLKEGRMSDILNSSQKDSFYTYTSSKLGMDSAIFENTLGKFKPFFFLQLPFASLVLNTESYDININKKARKAGIEIKGFESVEQQIGYFDKLSNDMKAEMIMQVIRDTANTQQEWETLQEMYLNQQISDMVTFNTGRADINAFYERTLSEERNKRWVSTLSKDLSEKSLFIAVGAGHLPGKEGLVHLLREEGYRVSPIQIKLK
jgi:uncharacterized protein